VRREAVVTAVPGQERHPPAGYLADRDRITGRTERSVNLDLFGAFEELVKARAADHSDTGQVRHADQATFSPDDLTEVPVVSFDFLSAEPLPPEAGSLDLAEDSLGCLSFLSEAETEPLRLSVR